MTRGGKREGAGRKPGVPNKANQRRQALVARTGDTPLDVMLKNMRRAQAEAEEADRIFDERLKAAVNGEKPFEGMLAEVKRLVGLRAFAQTCAKDAAPYVHPKLANVEHSGTGGGPIQAAMTVNVRFVNPGGGA